MSFDQVGVQAIVADQAAFVSAINQITNITINNMSRIASATQKMESESEKSFDGFARAFTGAIAAIGVERVAADIVNAFVSIGETVGQIGTEFEYTMAQVDAALQTTQNQAKELQDQIISLGQDSSTPLDDIASAIGDLGKAGVPIKDIYDGAGEALVDFVDASAGDVGAERAANLLASALNVFGIAGKDATRVTDALTNAARNSTATYNDMVTGAAQLNDLMANLNGTIEDEATWLGILSNRGLKGATAGRSLKSMLLGLQDPTDKQAALMNKLGISLTNADGSLATQAELFYRLNKALGPAVVASGQMTEAQRQEALGILFTTDSIRAALAVMNSAPDSFDNFKTHLHDVTTKEIADEIRDVFIPQIKELQNTLDGLIIDFTNEFIPSLTEGVKAIKEMLKNLDPKIPAAFGAALGAIFTGTQTGIPDFSKLFGPEVGAGINQFMTLLLTLRDTIVNQIVPAFAEMVKQFLNLLGVSNQQASVLPSLTAAIQAVGTALSDAMLYAATFFNVLSQHQETINIFVTAIEVLGVAIGVTLVALIAAAAVAIIAALSSIIIPALAVGAVAGAIVLAWKVFPEQISAIVASVISFLSALPETISSIFTTVVQTVSDVFSALPGIILSPLTQAQQSVTAFVQVVLGLFNSMVQTAVSIFAGLSIVAQLFAGMLSSVTGITAAGVTAVLQTISTFVTTAVSMVSAWMTANAQIVQTGMGIVIQIVSAMGKSLLGTFGFLWTGINTVTNLGTNENINTLNTFMANVAPAIVSWANGILASWSSFWTGMVNTVRSAINQILAGIRGLIASVPGLGTFDIFGKNLQDVIPADVPSFSIDLPGGQYTIQNIEQAASGIAAGVASAVGQIEATAQGAAGDIAGAIGDGLGKISDTAKAVGDTISGAVDSAASAVANTVDAARTAIGKFVDDFSKTVDAIKKDSGKLYDDVNATIAKLRAAQAAEAKAKADQERQAREAAMNPQEGGPTEHPAPGQVGEPGKEKTPKGGAGKKPKGAGGGGGGAGSAAEELQAIKDLVAELLADFPGLTQELVDFLAELEKATPGRLAGMVQALMDSKDIVGEMLVVKLKLLAASAELVQVEKNIAAIDNQIAIIDAEWAIKRIGYEQQLLVLKQQQNAIDQQLLPLKRQLLAIDYQISQVNREDYDLALKRAQLEYDALPIRYKIKDIEDQISKIGDKRLALAQREEEIRNRLAQMGTDEQLTQVNTKLDKAWADMNVPAILALEKQKQALEDQQKAQQAQADVLQNQIEKQSLLNELQSIPLQQQKLDLEDQLAPLEQKITLLDREKETQAALNDITLARLNGEKQKIEDLIAPLEYQRQLIQMEMDQVNLLKDAEQFAFDARKLQYEAMKAQEELRQADLKETIRVQDDLMADLVQKFAEGLAASGAFTLAESFEVAKRMKLWSDQIQKIGEIATEFNRVKGEVDKLTDAINAIPRDVTVHVNVVTSQTTAGGGGGDVATYQHGGTVPGPYGQPQLAIVHGGEHYMGIGRKPTAIRIAEATRTGAGTSHTSNTSHTEVNVAVPLPMVSTSAQRQMLIYKLNDIVRATRR